MEWLSALKTLQPFAIGGVLLLAYVAEHLYPQRRELIDYRHDARNIALGGLNAFLIFGAGYALQLWMLWYNNHGYGLLNSATLPAALRYGLEVLLLDCAMYWWHRANHRWPALWRFHRFHHADAKLNSTSALRFHAVELGLSYVWRAALFPLAGISISGFILYNILFAAVVIFHHSAIRMHPRADSVLRRGIVSPLMHRIHHSVLKEEADSNYGSVLPWWDRVFHSYRMPPGREVVFGTEDDIP